MTMMTVKLHKIEHNVKDSEFTEQTDTKILISQQILGQQNIS